MRSLIEIIQNKFILIIILSTIIRAQYPCSCSCCVGSNCQSCIISYAYAPSCTATSCLQVCSARYYQCAANAPYGQASGTCLSATTITPLSGPYSCRCDCCNLNSSSSCAPALVGYTTAYSCSTGSCSISCNSQYPLLCVSNQNGQTQGTCQGPSMTTTSTTTTGAWLGNACSCYCCQSGPYCLPTINVGNTSSPYCSMYACTQACQAQYPSLCPSTPYFGRTNGRCLNATTGNTRCQCRCCGTNGCRGYNVYTSAGCTSCLSLCQQQTQCANAYQTTQSCYENSSVLIRFDFFQLGLFFIVVQFTFVRTM
ncbi:unnamed protein product [Rotaria socialis]|uniref:Uncharacterized protein n=1 Tax=Rotaria socialis TaxID=392032 RepID=A0A817KB81_9BILA|nr:unnamed protein product [Rotaria socialis]CAF3432200.1 unnamed protein product [Rotaria socialis]CAF3512289.1 unnamed protein product [Rotaria socialis]